jgi:hypothetical protein
LAGKTSNTLIPKTQHDPEVAVTNNKIDQINKYTGAKKSVVNSIKEDQPSENIHQLTITTAGDTSLHQNSDLKNSDNQIRDINPEEKFNISRYLMENIIHDSAQITREIFKAIHKCLSMNMGWGVLAIIFLLCTTAKAAPMDLNETKIMEVNGTFDQISYPKIFSSLDAGTTTIIYGAHSMISKNYILNLGNVAKRITEDISDSCDAVSEQNNICRKDNATCPMAHLNKENYGSAVKKSFQTLTVLGMACESERRGTSSEAINNCLKGKNWITPKNSTEAFSFFTMMQQGFTHDFLQLEMEKIHSSIKKRSLQSGPIKLASGTHKDLAMNLFWQEISLKGSGNPSTTPQPASK